MTVCAIEDCGRPVLHLGPCRTHYRRVKKYGDPLADVPIGPWGQSCTVGGCANKHEAHGYCGTHYGRVLRHGHPTETPSRRWRGLDLTGLVNDRFLARFWGKVDKSGDCWVWTGSTNGQGYGQFSIRKGHQRLARIVSYVLANGPIEPKPFHVCHRCDNPPCVRPDHLFLGTSRDNTLDSVSKGRAYRAKGEATAAARLTAADVIAIRDLDYRFGLWAELGRKYGVADRTVKAAYFGTTWSHIPTPRKESAHESRLA